MTKYKFKYDKTILELDLPSEDIISVIEPNEFKPKFSNETDIVLDALANPIDSPHMKELFNSEQKICLMVNDITRLTKSELFVPLIIDALNKVDVPDKNITILFANGLHKEMNEKEMRTIIGDNVFDRVRIIQHDGVNSEFEFVGRTSSGNDVYVNKVALEADKLMLTGGIIMHHIAGYGGGRKNIIPGCARKDTILYNHNMVVDPKSTVGNMEDNPINRDLMEACSFVNPDFLFNVILDHNGRIAAAVAGHWETAHKEGCKIADKLYKVSMDERADLVIAGGGGSPKDIDLRQSKKGYYNALRAVKPGGVIISISACPEGISREGDPFEDWLEEYSTFDEVKKAFIEKGFDIGGLNAYRTREVQDYARLILITELDIERLGQLNIEAYSANELQKIVDRVRQEMGGNPKIILMPQAGLTLPECK